MGTISIDEIRQSRRLFGEPSVVDLATGKAKVDVGSGWKQLLNLGKRKAKDKAIKALDYVTKGRGQDTYDGFSDRFYQWKYGERYQFVKDITLRTLMGDYCGMKKERVPYAELESRGRLAEHEGDTFRVPIGVSKATELYMTAHEVVENQYMRKYRKRDRKGLPAEMEGEYEAILLSALRSLARERNYEAAGEAGEAYNAALEIHRARGRNDRFLKLTKKYNTELGQDMRALKLAA